MNANTAPPQPAPPPTPEVALKDPPHAALDDDPAIQGAQALFARYIDLAAAFDPEFATLYAPEAVIRNRRTYLPGVVRDVVLTGKAFSELILGTLPWARSRGDLNTFSEVEFTAEGEGARISGIRRSHLKGYESPFSIRVAPRPGGGWWIVEEQGESRP